MNFSEYLIEKGLPAIAGNDRRAEIEIERKLRNPRINALGVVVDNRYPGGRFLTKDGTRVLASAPELAGLEFGELDGQLAYAVSSSRDEFGRGELFGVYLGTEPRRLEATGIYVADATRGEFHLVVAGVRQSELILMHDMNVHATQEQAITLSPRSAPKGQQPKEHGRNITYNDGNRVALGFNNQDDSIEVRQDYAVFASRISFNDAAEALAQLQLGQFSLASNDKTAFLLHRKRYLGRSNEPLERSVNTFNRPRVSLTVV